jgi:hypothetical protein
MRTFFYLVFMATSILCSAQSLKKIQDLVTSDGTFSLETNAISGALNYTSKTEMTTDGGWSELIRALPANMQTNEQAQLTEAVIVSKPNPTSGFTFISINHGGPSVTLSLIDPSGRTLRTENLRSENGIYSVPFDLSGFAKGIYLLCVTDTNRSFFQKIVLI